MDPENQKLQISKSLKIITEIFSSCNANYRIIGSVLLVAYTNRVFRHINDVDVILAARARDFVFQKLRDYGFVFEQKTAAGFSWVEAKKEGYLGFTFLLVGNFEEKYFGWKFMKILELRIKADYLRPTECSFDGVTFVGIPVSSIVAGIRQSFLNPKRKIDKQILKREIDTTKIKSYNNISVYIFGLKLPYLYDLFSFFYNIYGGIRVMRGRKYEIWD